MQCTVLGPLHCEYLFVTQYCSPSWALSSGQKAGLCLLMQDLTGACDRNPPAAHQPARAATAPPGRHCAAPAPAAAAEVARDAAQSLHLPPAPRLLPVPLQAPGTAALSNSRSAPIKLRTQHRHLQTCCTDVITVLQECGKDKVLHDLGVAQPIESAVFVHLGAAGDDVGCGPRIRVWLVSAVTPGCHMASTLLW